MISANINNNLRKQIYRREGYRCALCDSTRYLQIHHIVPRGRGGSNSEQNLICLCSDCHAAIHGTILQDWWDVTPQDLEQAVVEYMSDYYINSNGRVWNPYQKGKAPYHWEGDGEGG